MDRRIASRLSELRREFETGQLKLGQLEVEQNYLRERLLMLKGAIAMLEDLLTDEPLSDHRFAADNGQLVTPDGADSLRE